MFKLLGVTDSDMYFHSNVANWPILMYVVSVDAGVFIAIVPAGKRGSTVVVMSPSYTPVSLESVDFG